MRREPGSSIQPVSSVKPLLTLKNVGVLLRDNHQKFPLEYLQQVFGRVGAAVHVLNAGPPGQPLELILAMGGDGTVLRALDLEFECPVLGINYGTVGFLTAGDRDDLEHLVRRLLNQDFFISERMLLRCTWKDRSINVVNEVVLRAQWRMVNIDVMVDDTKIRTIRGDGVIVGTPTGSTGYLLSTGSPIVMPDAQCFVVDG
ncbi:MAG: NAD(+)/NADH kinase, partial [Deltaproteobacteria bacterium]|nr:NAD(+)/NADH kinase [Deltaproteobacteria bacterium]